MLQLVYWLFNLPVQLKITNLGMRKEKQSSEKFSDVGRPQVPPTCDPTILGALWCTYTISSRPCSQSCTTHSEGVCDFQLFLRTKCFRYNRWKRTNYDSLPDSSRKYTPEVYLLLAEAVGRRITGSRPHPWSWPAVSGMPAHLLRSLVCWAAHSFLTNSSYTRAILSWNPVK